MRRYCYETKSDLPPELLYRTIADIKRWPEWDDEIEGIEIERAGRGRQRLRPEATGPQCGQAAHRDDGRALSLCRCRLHAPGAHAHRTRLHPDAGRDAGAEHDRDRRARWRPSGIGRWRRAMPKGPPARRGVSSPSRPCGRCSFQTRTSRRNQRPARPKAKRRGRAFAELTSSAEGIASAALGLARWRI